MVDTLASKPSVRKDMLVQVQPSAPKRIGEDDGTTNRATPILRGKDATRFLAQMRANENKKVGLVPTPRLYKAKKLLERYKEDTMEKQGKAKILFYRETEVRRGKEVKPKGVYVCLVKMGRSVVARGVAVCSRKDNLIKKIGRETAYKRAIMAVEQKSDIKPLNKAGFEFKGFYKPELTAKEKLLTKYFA